MGGKEALIKAVATAVLTYTMSCFKLPKKLCTEMNNAMCKFWWGQKESEGRIYWKSWLKKTAPNLDDGLGFKNLEQFIIPLLAKQCWRMMQEHDALWVQIFKGIYFPNGSVMCAKKGAWASWAQTSLLFARDFLKEEILWQIENGESVDIWNDRWLPRLKGKSIYNPGMVGEDYLKKWLIQLIRTKVNGSLMLLNIG